MTKHYSKDSDRDLSRAGAHCAQKVDATSENFQERIKQDYYRRK